MFLMGCSLSARVREAVGPLPESVRGKSDGVLAEAPAPLPGDEAPDFVLPDIHRNQVPLSDYRGQVVLLNFWASWCGPCRIEIPSMIGVYDELHDAGFEILAINVRESDATASRFAKEMGMEFPVLLDSRGEVSRRYYVRGIPTNVVIDRDGIVRDVHVGVISKARLRDLVVSLMR